MKANLRPKTFDEFIGDSNKKTIEKIKIVTGAAKIREESPGHILLYGSPGTGKTTVARIIANELEYEFRTITGGTIKNQMDVYELLCEVNKAQQLGTNFVLFIDEIHCIASADMPEEMWFPLLEDFSFYHNLKNKTVIIDEEEYRVNFSKITVDPFLVIGATTAPGDLSKALRDRFSLHCSLKEYTESDLEKIIFSYAEKCGILISTEACAEIARRGRGNPRVSLNLLSLIKDKALIEQITSIEKEFVSDFLDFLNLDEHGLSTDDLKILEVLFKNEKGMGLSNLAGTAGIEKSILEEIVLPFLQFRGLTKTTHKRFITEEGKKYLKK